MLMSLLGDLYYTLGMLQLYQHDLELGVPADLFETICAEAEAEAITIAASKERDSKTR